MTPETPLKGWRFGSFVEGRRERVPQRPRSDGGPRPRLFDRPPESETGKGLQFLLRKVTFTSIPGTHVQTCVRLWVGRTLQPKRSRSNPTEPVLTGIFRGHDQTPSPNRVCPGDFGTDYGRRTDGPLRSDESTRVRDPWKDYLYGNRRTHSGVPFPKSRTSSQVGGVQCRIV